MPTLGEPGDCSADTFLCGGLFNSNVEPVNFLTYFKTRFFRALLGIKKTTQHCPPTVWESIPIQDFSKNSDIDWSKSIHEIDLQLYQKYGLSEEEVTFIESKVAPMDGSRSD